MPDENAAAEASEYLLHCMKEQNSSGGIVECIVNGLPTGLGDPVFEKLDANLGKAILSIGAVKAIEIGDGMAVASATGRSNNDPFLPGENGTIKKASNHAGGVLGGISDGSPPDPSGSHQTNPVHRLLPGHRKQTRGTHLRLHQRPPRPHHRPPRRSSRRVHDLPRPRRRTPAEHDCNDGQRKKNLYRQINASPKKPR